MPLSGGGIQTRKYKRVERMLYRDLPAVSAEYEQDIIPYEKSFWKQYRLHLMTWFIGFLVNITPLFLAVTSLTNDIDMWGMWPTLAFCGAILPFICALPLFWYNRYCAQQSIMDEVE